MHRLPIAVILLVLFSWISRPASVSAQQSMIGLSYNMSLPMGETSQFVDALSWRGASFEYRQVIQPQSTLGLFVGWNVFHSKESGVFIDGTEAVSGTQLRTVNAFPILFTGHYYLGEDYGRRIHLGMGVGTYRTLQQTQLGVFADEERSWQFGLSPSVGVLVPTPAFNTFINAELRYHYAFRSGEALNHSYLSLNLGLVWGQ